MSFIFSYISNLVLSNNKLLGNVASFILAITLGIYAGNMPLDSMDDVAQSDIRSYFGNYNNVNSNNFEWGYRMISHFFASQGVEYYYFRTVFSIILMLILWETVSKISEYNAMFFFSFYSIFPFFVDTIQFRTMIALIFIVMAYRSMIDSHNIRVILLLLCGSLFQTLTIVFLLVIPLYYLHSENAFKSIKSSIYYVVIPMLFIMFAYLFGVFRYMVTYISYISGRNDLIEAYVRLSFFKTGWNYIFIYIIALSIEIFIISKIFSDLEFNKNKQNILRASAPFLLIGMYALSVVRFYTDINRYYRISEVILFVLVTVYLSENRRNGISVKSITIFVSTFILTVISGYVFYRGSDFPHIINIMKLNG